MSIKTMTMALMMALVSMASYAQKRELLFGASVPPNR